MTILDPRIAVAAKSLIAAAAHVFERDRILPRPAFHPYIKIGQDYFGGSLMYLPEFEALEAAVAKVHSRFREETPLPERDFASTYIFSFLEACVARCCRNDEPLSATAESVETSLADLARTLASNTWEVACCREISHLTTLDGRPIDLLEVTVTPLIASPADHTRQAHALVDDVIAGAERAYLREAPSGYDPPESIVVARGCDGKPFEFVDVLSDRIERFLLFTRLLHAGTCHSMYEVRGETCLVRRFDPTLILFRGDNRRMMSSTHAVRRTTRLDAADSARLAGLAQIFDQAVRRHPGVFVTSFDMAVHKFQLSYHAYAWYEQVVDLATAFEAVLSGKETSDLTLRLKTRAAALFATESDSAANIFRDIGTLYELRSRLVHGGDLTQKELKKRIRAISSVTKGRTFGFELGCAVDRLRDLVRRGILARICLASGATPLWTLGEDAGVDAKLADNRTREEWRLAWHGILESFGAFAAAEKPQAAVDIILPEDQ